MPFIYWKIETGRGNSHNFFDLSIDDQDNLFNSLISHVIPYLFDGGWEKMRLGMTWTFQVGCSS